MIGLAALWIQAQATQDLVGVGVAAPLPVEWGAKDHARLEVLARASLRATRDFGRSEMLDLTDGRPVTFQVQPDGVLLSLLVRRQRVTEAISLVEDLLRNPVLAPADLQRAQEDGGDNSPWLNAIGGSGTAIPPVTKDQLVKLGDRVFRKDALQIAFSGKNIPSEWEADWKARIARWTHSPIPRYPDNTAFQLLPATGTPYWVGSLLGPGLKADRLPAAELLALYALGVGKDTPLFAISREKQGWSYRQEAHLLPVREGWKMRLSIAMADVPKETVAERLESLRDDLAKAVSRWDEATRARALAMVGANLDRGLGFGPIYLGGRILVGDPQAEAEIGAMWSLKLKRSVSLGRVRAEIGETELPAMKQAALEFLAGARTEIF